MQDWKCGTSFNSWIGLKKTQKITVHRCITCILSYAAVVFSVPLKSAKNTQFRQWHGCSEKTLNTLQSQENTRKTTSIGVRHNGHLFPIHLTASAEQKRAWPHGTNAKPSRGTCSMQSSHISVADDTAFRNFFRTYHTDITSRQLTFCARVIANFAFSLNVLGIWHTWALCIMRSIVVTQPSNRPGSRILSVHHAAGLVHSCSAPAPAWS